MEFIFSYHIRLILNFFGGVGGEGVGELGVGVGGMGEGGFGGGGRDLGMGGGRVKWINPKHVVLFLF